MSLVIRHQYYKIMYWHDRWWRCFNRYVEYRRPWWWKRYRIRGQLSVWLGKRPPWPKRYFVSTNLHVTSLSSHPCVSIIFITFLILFVCNHNCCLSKWSWLLFLSFSFLMFSWKLAVENACLTVNVYNWFFIVIHNLNTL